MTTWRHKLASFAFVAVSLCLTSTHLAAELMNEPAPDFTLKAKSGENVRLQELSGDVVLVNFWASWCGPCRKEMPLLQKLQDKYKDMGFTVLGINVEEQNDAAKNFIDEVGVSFPILLDETNQVSKLYQVEAMPTTVIIDRKGNKRYVHYGFQSGDEAIYKKVVKALVRE